MNRLLASTITAAVVAVAVAFPASAEWRGRGGGWHELGGWHDHGGSWRGPG